MARVNWPLRDGELTMAWARLTCRWETQPWRGFRATDSSTEFFLIKLDPQQPEPMELPEFYGPLVAQQPPTFETVDRRPRHRGDFSTPPARPASRSASATVSATSVLGIARPSG